MQVNNHDESSIQYTKLENKEDKVSNKHKIKKDKSSEFVSNKLKSQTENNENKVKPKLQRSSPTQFKKIYNNDQNFVISTIQKSVGVDTANQVSKASDHELLEDALENFSKKAHSLSAKLESKLQSNPSISSLDLLTALETEFKELEQCNLKCTEMMKNLNIQSNSNKSRQYLFGYKNFSKINSEFIALYRDKLQKEGAYHKKLLELREQSVKYDKICTNKELIELKKKSIDAYNKITEFEFTASLRAKHQLSGEEISEKSLNKQTKDLLANNPLYFDKKNIPEMIKRELDTYQKDIDAVKNLKNLDYFK